MVNYFAYYYIIYVYLPIALFLLLLYRIFIQIRRRNKVFCWGIDPNTKLVRYKKWVKPIGNIIPIKKLDLDVPTDASATLSFKGKPMVVFNAITGMPWLLNALPILEENDKGQNVVSTLSGKRLRAIRTDIRIPQITKANNSEAAKQKERMLMIAGVFVAIILLALLYMVYQMFTIMTKGANPVAGG